MTRTTGRRIEAGGSASEGLGRRSSLFFFVVLFVFFCLGFLGVGEFVVWFGLVLCLFFVVEVVVAGELSLALALVMMGPLWEDVVAEVST